MARTNIEVNKVFERNAFSGDIKTLVTAVGADGAEFEMSDNDFKYLILFQNTASAAKVATILKGNGIEAVKDVSTTIAANSYQFVSIDSSRCKIVSGDDKGKVIINADTGVSVAVFKLP